MIEQLSDLTSTDLELARQAQEDPLSFGLIYERYVDRIHSFLSNLTHNPTIAEDLTSVTFIKALEAFPRFKVTERASLRAWLFRIARNNLYNYWRDNKRRSNVPLSSFLPDNPLFGQFSDPSEDVEKAEQAEKVRHAFDKLNPRERIAIYLHVVEGLPNKEVGQIIGRVVKTEGVAKAVINRGLKKLKQELD